MARRASVPWILALVLALLSSCAGAGSRDGDWVEADVVIASERVLRQAAAIALEKNDFPPSTEQGGLQSTVASSWKVDLQPFKGEGLRRRAYVQYEERGPGTWRVSVRVEKQTNEELARPLELERAQWEDAPDDREAAGRILRYLLLVFGEKGSQLAPSGDAEAEGGG